MAANRGGGGEMRTERATGVLRLCSGLARRGGGDRKEWAPLVSERERGETGRATKGRGFGRDAGGAGWLARWAAASATGPAGLAPGAWGFSSFFFELPQREKTNYR